MKYSFVILLDSYKDLKKKLKIINKFSNIQIIVVGPKKYQDMFSNYIVEDLTNTSLCFDKAIPVIKGDYVNFSFASSSITQKSINKITEYINKSDNKEIIALNYVSKNSYHLKDTTFDDGKTIKVTDNVNYVNPLIDCYFFPTDKIDNFNTDLKDFGCLDFIIRNINTKGEYTEFYNDYIKLIDSGITSPKSIESTNKEWYTDFIENYVLKLLKNSDNYYTKSICYYLILIRFIANADASNKMALDEKELKEFHKVVKDCLKYIPDDIILNINSSNIGNNHNDTMIMMKNKNFFEQASNELLKELALSKIINICAINNEEKELVFDIEYDGIAYINKGFKIITKLNNKELEIKENQIYSDNMFFGIKIKDKYTFQIMCPKRSIKNKAHLEFYLSDGKDEHLLRIGFNNARTAARLSNLFTHTYWKYDNNMILTTDFNKIYFKKTNLIQRFNQEIKLYQDFLTKSQKKKLGIQALFLRILYRLTRFIYRHQKIWITFDKLYKAGDNGEYFYQYCKNNQDKVKCYYIINKDAYDYKRLKNDKNVITFKSTKSYLKVLNSQCVFATHAGASNFMAFTGGKEKYFRDLMNYDLFCLQHGLTIQDIPHLQNRVRDNTKLYFCASGNEIQNLLQPKYDYKEEVLLKTGIPRYDGLKNNDKREILITPTWRSNMANTVTVIGGTRPYYEDFKNTEYFKIFNTIINDKRLIEAARKYNYRITYLLHPTLTAQIDDFDKNDYVDIFTVTADQSYEKLLTESSLMVTDYSGVQYDFAYMRKPIIYFHPDELPPHYGAGGIDYEKEGFGPIIKTIDQLVDELINKMKNDCKNDKKYINRADNFFIYDDFDSCKRIYDETMKYINEKKR